MNDENLEALTNKLNEIIAQSEEKLKLLHASVESAKEKEKELNIYNNRIAELKGIAETNNNSVAEILNQVNVNKETIQTFHDESKNNHDEINSFNSKIEESKKKIGEILAEGEETIKNVSNILIDANSIDGQINACKSVIEELKARAEEKVESISQLLTEASDVRRKIDELYDSTRDLNGQVTTLYDQCKSRTEEINKFYSVFEDLKGKIENPDTGIASTLESVKKISLTVLDTNKEATAAKENIIADKLKSSELLRESLKLKDDISHNYEQSEKTKSEIGKILDLVRDTGLANSFDKRRKRSQRSLVIWGGVILFGIILSAYLIHKVFLSKESEALFDKVSNDYIKFLLRITLTAPGVFTAWFGASQYSKERYYLEQYEFKTAAALALENYTKLLRESYPEKLNEIFPVNIEMIKSVYKEPEYFKPKTSMWAKIKHPKSEGEFEAGAKQEE